MPTAATDPFRGHHRVPWADHPLVSGLLARCLAVRAVYRSSGSPRMPCKWLMMRLSEDRGRVNLPEKLLDGGLQSPVWTLEDDVVVRSAGASQRGDAGDVMQESEQVVLLLTTGDADDLQIPRRSARRRHFGSCRSVGVAAGSRGGIATACDFCDTKRTVSLRGRRPRCIEGRPAPPVRE